MLIKNSKTFNIGSLFAITFMGVLIAIFLFGLYFFIIDNIIGRGVDFLFQQLTK